MRKSIKRCVLVLISAVMILAFLPAIAFATEATTGGHSVKGYGEFTTFDSVDADTEGLKVLVPPTCNTVGIGVITCDDEINGVACGFPKTVWINTTPHTAGPSKCVSATELMGRIGFDSNYFYTRGGGRYAYCLCYVYQCKTCGEYVDEQGRKINAMWESGNNPDPAVVVCPDPKDIIKEHAWPENVPNCQKSYSCEKCGYSIENEHYDENYHNPDNDIPKDKKLTYTHEHVHSSLGRYVDIIKFTCGLCGGSFRRDDLVGYNSWDEVEHPNQTRVVIGNMFSMVCDDCGRVISTGIAEQTIGNGPQQPDSGGSGSSPVTPVNPYNADVTFSVLTEANCEQGSWIVATMNGSTKIYMDDKMVEAAIKAGDIELVGDKYYTKYYMGTDKVEVPYTPAFKHDFGGIVKVADATCEGRAYEGKLCSKCGKIYHIYGTHEVEKPLGHDIKSYKVAPTCGAKGYSYDTCERCKLYINHTTKKVNLNAGLENVIDMYDVKSPVVAIGTPCQFVWKGTKAPTDTEDGEKALVCKVCSAVKEGSEVVVPRDSDEAKDVAIEVALPTVEAASSILSSESKYTDASVNAIKEAKQQFDAACSAGSAADVTRAAQKLKAAVDSAAPKAENTMTVKAKTVKARAGKKTSIKKTKAFTVRKAQGQVTFRKKSGNKKITVSRAGKVTVKKGLKKGKTYKVKVKVTAAGNKNYLAGTKTVTLKVKIR